MGDGAWRIPPFQTFQTGTPNFRWAQRGLRLGDGFLCPFYFILWLFGSKMFTGHTHTHTQLEKSTDFPGYLKYSPAAVASAFQAVNPGATFPPAHTHPWPGHAQSHAAPGSAHAESHRRVPGSGVETSLSVLCCFWPGPQC